MAKNWTIEEDYMIRAYKDEAVDTLDIELNKLFPEFEDLEKVQQACIVNGIKQKLDDSIARSKDMKLTEAEKREVQAALWERITIEREWNMPKQAGGRGPSVSLKTLIPALEAANMTVEVMATVTGKTVEAITKFLATGIEETKE